MVVLMPTRLRRVVSRRLKASRNAASARRWASETSPPVFLPDGGASDQNDTLADFNCYQTSTIEEQSYNIWMSHATASARARDNTFEVLEDHTYH